MKMSLEESLNIDSEIDLKFAKFLMKKMYKFKVLCPSPELFSEAGLKFAEKNFDLTIQKMDQKFDSIAMNYDGVLIRFNICVGKIILVKGSKLKFIISPTTGINHIDLQEAKKKNVKVFHLREEKEFKITK